MTLLQLNYVVEIAEHGSINKAAKNLFVSQSSISSAIRDLEEEIGITIFHRNNKGAEFTDEGHRFFSHIKPIIDQEKKVKSLYSAKGGRVTLRLRVSSQHYPFSVQAFVQLLESVSQNKYDLQLKETSTYTIIENVSSGESDLGILFLSNTTKAFLKRILSSRDLEFHPLKAVPPHAYLRKGHPLAYKESISAHELDQFPYAIFDKDHSVSLNFSEEVVLTGFEPSQKTISINDRCAMYSVLAHSDAFSIGSGLLPEGFYDSDIVSIPIVAPVDQVQLGWIQQKGRILTQIAEDYIKILKAVLEQISG